MTTKIAALLLVFLSFWAVGATPAQGDPVTPAQAAAASTSDATLTVNNRDIFTFRSALLGVSAEDRAWRARKRIRQQLDLAGPKVVSAKTESIGVLVQIDGATSFAITPDDLDKLQQETLDSAAKEAMAVLTTVIQESREGRNLDALARAIGFAALATAVFVGLLWLVRRARRLLEERLIELTQRQSQRLRIGGVELLRRDRVAALVHYVLTGVFWLVSIFVFYEWLSFVMGRFPITRPWGELLDSFLFDLVVEIGTAIVHALPGLFTALIIFFLARAVVQMLDGFFTLVQTGRLLLSWLDADVVMPTRRISKAIVWLFALAMAYPYLPGSGTEAFKGLSVLVGLMLSLGASNLVGQAASGLILTYGRVFRKGEYVRLDNNEGTVTEMGFFSTRIRTGMGVEITLSNSAILGTTTVNYSRTVKGVGFVLDTTVTIGYDTPWRQVHAMLTEAAARTLDVLADPPPVVFQTALSDYYPEYRLVCQAVPAQPRPRAQVLSALHANIQDVFNEYGVQIMSPHYFGDPADAKVVPPDRWYAAPAAGEAPAAAIAGHPSQGGIR